MKLNTPAIMESIGMPLHPGQLDVFNRMQRFNIMLCGRRWGKSLLIAALLFHFIFHNPRARLWLVAPIHLQNKEVMMYLDEILSRLGEPHKYSTHPEHKMTIGKSIVECRSADNPVSMRGAGLDAIFVDEACYVRDLETLWFYSLRAALADKKGTAFIASSPAGKDWVWKQTQTNEWTYFNHPTANNPYIDGDEISEMKRTMPDLVFRSEVMAEIIGDFGLAFPDAIQSVERIPDGPKTHVLGLDWGWAEQFAAILIAKSVDGISYAYKELYEVGLTPTEQAGMVLRMGLPDKCQKYADASTFTAAGRESIADQWGAAGLRTLPATRDRMGSLQLLRVLIREGLFKVVAGRCPSLEREFAEAKISSRNREDITGADHLIDATRYGISGIHLQQPQREPDKWSPAYVDDLVKMQQGYRSLL